MCNSWNYVEYHLIHDKRSAHNQKICKEKMKQFGSNKMIQLEEVMIYISLVSFAKRTFLKLFSLFYFYEYFVCILCIMYKPVHMRAREFMRSPSTGVTCGCVPLPAYWESNSGSP